LPARRANPLQGAQVGAIVHQGLNAPNEATAFAQAQAGRAKRAVETEPPELPQWLQDMAYAGKGTKAIIDELIKRTLEDPSEPNLRLAQVVLNDLARDPAVAAALRERLAGPVLDRLTHQPTGHGQRKGASGV
jgi:hypothetical protein